MTVRPALPIDVPQIVAMALEFLSTEYEGRIEPDAAAIGHFAEWLIASPEHLALVLEDRGGAIQGMFGALLHVHPMSGDTIATEVAWWVNPEERRGGLRLLKAAETWARERGACRMQMIAPSPKVEQFYQRVGFQKLETVYQRSV